MNDEISLITKLLDEGVASASGARRLVLQGAVQVAGQTAQDPQARVPTSAAVQVGRPGDPRQRRREEKEVATKSIPQPPILHIHRPA